MSHIQLRKENDYHPIIQLRENVETKSNNKILIESAHAFDEQYKWAKNVLK